MANTYTSLHYHVIFSTKNREPWIRQDVEQRIWSYLGGIARENEIKAVLIGGIENHLHLLLGVPPSLAVSKAVQLIKGGSSKWIKDTFQEQVPRPGSGNLHPRPARTSSTQILRGRIPCTFGQARNSIR